MGDGATCKSCKYFTSCSEKQLKMIKKDSGNGVLLGSYIDPVANPDGSGYLQPAVKLGRKILIPLAPRGTCFCDASEYYVGKPEFSAKTKEARDAGDHFYEYMVIEESQAACPAYKKGMFRKD